MHIQTERLSITPFTQENYIKVSETYSVRNHIINYLDKLKEDPELLGWGAWFVTLTDNQQIIGDIGFKGKPDHQGIVEVGFGLIPEMHNMGIATESVGAIIEWALSSKKVQKIVAECLIDNIPSIRVLEKLSFTRTGVENGMINWELVKDQSLHSH
ncbi:GNAT family N-acetyltransferase [Paenibacillus sp. FSL P4-0338]|uniref:GNAT family N-acetyltransferase n=1 Tax=unclassified Paenibacillus TaxID=185978 RepID=UPI0003E2952E|nr:GNAT family N-acetyltransferase [Paenibacillus sp. FSL R7-269]ETT45561.1 acetyltransferase [Paenibacillus sp. FSL R7-269]